MTDDKPDKTLRPIIIEDRSHSLPYSKGLMTSTFTATGLPPSRAYAIAKTIDCGVPR